MLGHGHDKAGDGPHHLGRLPFHQGDRAGQTALTILGQALGEEKVAVNPFRCRFLGGHGTVGEGDRLAQLVLRPRQEQAGPADRFGDVLGVGLAEAIEQGPAGAAVLLLLSEEQAQLGVSEPGSIIGGVGIEYLPPVVQRLLPSSLPKQDACKAGFDLRVIRVELDGLLAVLVGFVQPALRSQGVGEVVVGPGIVGVELDSLSIAVDRLVQSTLGLQCQAQIAVGPGVTGSRVGGPSVVFGRLSQVVLESQGVADGTVAHRAPGRLANAAR